VYQKTPQDRAERNTDSGGGRAIPQTTSRNHAKISDKFIYQEAKDLRDGIRGLQRAWGEKELHIMKQPK